MIKVIDMVENILKAFKSMLTENTWMDDESKEKALEKADYIKSQIGYPDVFDNEEYLNSNFNVSLKKYKRFFS